MTATHGHPDHLSGAPAIADRYGVGVHLAATTVSYIDASATPRTPSVAQLVPGYRSPWRGRPSPRPVTPKRYLDDAE
ncbi:MBL fold metallo-hydrolase [Nocardia gamkensis]|uniref:MBL fold metallo-hydrolase n=1 Tax=Nocardia gamkensis TaxID=352869 RepID=UPI0036E0F4A9